jgi:Fe(3+) dicitrate transport protein
MLGLPPLIKSSLNVFNWFMKIDEKNINPSGENMFQLGNTKVVSLGLVVLLIAVNVGTQEAASAVEKEYKIVTVTASREHPSALSDIEGSKIYSGKKTSMIDLAEAPAVVNNNFRQTLQKTPGLLLSEEATPLFSVGYRGLDPHRAQFTQVLKDGIPIHADMIGYPEAYYVPSLETIDHIDFIRGGGSLMYGPQPGGALNFVTKDPYEYAPLAVTFENSGGSHGLFSNYTGVSGTQNGLGYLGYFQHRQSQGFRANNSQSEVFSGGSKFKITSENDPGVWRVGFDVYEEAHGEPGGLTRADFDSDKTIANRRNDQFELNRYAGSLAYEKEIDEDLFFDFKIFGGYYERLSWRQRTTGSSFGTVPSGTTNDIEKQEFFTGGAESRFRRTYEGFGSDENALTAGILYYHVTSPRIDKRGTAADALDGDIRKDADRDVNYISVFAENLFKFNKLSVTPGIRLENIWQSVQENINLDKTTVPLADEGAHDTVPLLGLGAAYELSATTEMYSNISQGYRPKIFTQAVPTGSGQVVNSDLEEGKSWQADLGLRGVAENYFSWDGSVFYMVFNDQIGTSGSTVENVGDSTHQGIELAGEFNLSKWLDHNNGNENKDGLGEVSFFMNTMLLDARFTEGSNKGKTPQYAPDFIFKTGVEYNYRDYGKLRLAGTFVDDHFANDSNTTTFIVPSYKVWDLTTEVKLFEEVRFFGGINNLFDEHYFARVRSDGIDPADGRNYYAGVKLNW